MGWDHIEGDIDVPYLTERESFRDVLETCHKKCIKVEDEYDLFILPNVVCA